MLTHNYRITSYNVCYTKLLRTQTIYFYDPRRSQFSIWEVTNQSEIPIETTNGFGVGNLHQDSVIYGDVELTSHIFENGTATQSIDLNGYTLTIKGNVVNNRINLIISKGRLIIEGDFRLQVPRNIGGGNEALRWSSGTLRMLNDEDYVLVTGDFYQDSYYSHSVITSYSIHYTKLYDETAD